MTRVLLLAAGLGMRLRPLTDRMPKCLVPIKGQPLLGIWLERLSAAGYGPFLINTHYLVNQVEAFIMSSPYRERVHLVNEPVLLGTAGTLMRNLNFFEHKDCLLIHADNYCLENFSSFLRAHSLRPRGCLMTMMTFRATDPSTCGIVEVDKNGIVTSFHEKVANPPGNLANCAVYILSKELLQKLAMEMPQASDFSVEVLSQLVGQIFTYETHEPFVDIGTPDNYAYVNSYNVPTY